MKRSRKDQGYALIVVISMVALMMTFLIAAQGSALVGRNQMQRRADRMQERQWIDQALIQADNSVKAGTGAEGLLVNIVIDPEVGPQFELTDKTPEVNPYGIHPNLKKVEGDHIVEVVLSRIGGYRVRHLYLLNSSGSRSGSIRIQ